MSTLKLVFAGIKHTWLRNLLLMLSVVIAYTLFGVLLAFERAYTSSADVGANRIITANKISFTQPLPFAHFRAVRGIDGNHVSSIAAWFGGYYRERRNALHALAVDPITYLAVYGDDLQLSEQERSTFLSQRGSMLVGESMAQRFGWRVGDQVPIFNRRISRKDGSETWTFKIAGIFKGASPVVDTSFLYIHYELLNEARASEKDTITFVVTKPAPGQDPGKLGETIDRLFETAAVRTTTDTERSFAQAFVAQFGDLALVTILILGTAFFSLLIIVASTTALAIQQRAREVGILKGLGFSHTHVLTMLISESLAVILVAGVAGLAIATLLVQSAAGHMVQIAPGMAVSSTIVAIGVLSMIMLAIAASALPAWQSVNTATSTVLRRG
ncbi:MAG: FtsX-like permease family protein [Pseudomonadota bacterium]